MRHACRTSAPLRAEQQPARRPASACATGTPSAAARPASPSPDPADPEHRLCRRVRRLHLALRPPHPPGPQRQHLPVQPVRPRRRGPALSLPVDRADPDLAARSARSIYHAANVLFRTSDGGQTWTADQPRPDAQRQEQAEVVRRPDHRRQHRRRDLRHDLRHRRVAEAEGPALGRQRRRPGPRHARRRQDLGRTSPQNITGLPEWGTVGCIEPSPLRRRHRLRRRRRPPARRHAAVPVQDDRLRQDLDRASAASLPQDVYLHVVREDPKQQGAALPRHASAASRSRPTTARPGSR